MKSIFCLSLTILGLCNILQTVWADHCDPEHDVTLAPAKIDDKNYKFNITEETSCSLSYLSILNPDESPTADDGCKIRGFHLKGGSVGPSCIPELGNLQRDQLFSTNVESHRTEAGKLFEVLFKCESFEDFKNAALYYKSKVNPMLFSYVFSTAIINRPDTHNFPVPNLHQTDPDLFFNDKIIDEAQQKLKKNVKRSRKSHEESKYFKSENKPHKLHSKPKRPVYSSRPEAEDLGYTIIMDTDVDEAEEKPKDKNQIVESVIELPENIEWTELPYIELLEQTTIMSDVPKSKYPVRHTTIPMKTHRRATITGRKGPPIRQSGRPSRPKPAPPKTSPNFIKSLELPPHPTGLLFSAPIPKFFLSAPDNKPLMSEPHLNNEVDAGEEESEDDEPNRQQKLALIPAPEEKEYIEDKQEPTMNDNNPEYKMTYFREDIAINSHHDHWHAFYPMFWKKDFGIKDRKGELFYYMHNQMIRRYNGDRMANGLPFVKPLKISESDTHIEDGYYPHLKSRSTGNHYSGRCRHLKLRDIDRSRISKKAPRVKIRDLLKWIDTVINAIDDGYVVDTDYTRLPLNEENGIDLLGSAVESSEMSINKPLYGDIHNSGHVLLSFIHDNIGEFEAPPSVMYSTATALRDPVFWRWHKMVDDLLNLHKAKLPPYNETYLTWKDIKIKKIDIKSSPGEGENSYPPNSCYTYKRSRQLDISRGLDFDAAAKVVRINITHLDHDPFEYNIEVNSQAKKPVDGHVRIFISPKYSYTENEDDGSVEATDEELRQNSIEMDRFTIKLSPGPNKITRGSKDSAVTMLPGRQWVALSESDVEFSESSQDVDKGSCGCGWPDHLLVPRGTEKGIKYVLFVMISNWSKEEVKRRRHIYRTCDSSLTMCGLLHKKFPDKRPMGFPLDRPILQENWFDRPNMIRKDITIYHSE